MLLILINIVPVEELYESEKIFTTVFLTIFYYLICFYLFSALTCVYIEEFRIMYMEKGPPTPLKFDEIKRNFIIWLDPLAIFTTKLRQEQIKEREKTESS